MKLLIATLLLATASVHAQTLQNKSARIDFNLGTGTYNLTTQPGGILAISNAHATVEGWSSTDIGYQRRITTQSRDQLQIECARPDAPTLLLEFKLHPSFVELRSGLKNTTGTPLRIKTLQPLTGGGVFPGAIWTDARTLNAPSGTNQPRVTDDTICSSANNLLLTFKQSGARRSLVLGALKTADFTKWAHTRPLGGVGPSRLEHPGLRVVSYLDCGGAETVAPHLRLARGQPYAWHNEATPFGSVFFDAEAVEFRADQLDPQKNYALGFSWWDVSSDGRVQSVIVTGSDRQPHPLVENRALPQQTGPLSEAAVIPKGCYADGKLHIAFTNDAKVPNAVVSEIWLWEVVAGATLPTSLATARSTAGSVNARLEAYDPIGRLVEPGETYLPEDSFYVDAGTADPFAALEQYGWALRDATGAKPNPYDFATVCAWCAGVWETTGAQNHPDKSMYKINTSAGLVEEAREIQASGFLNYSRAAVRLVPDTYANQNPQGWWDDEHWQRHGYYTAPYETSAKLGKAMRDIGCLAFTYIQPMLQPPGHNLKFSEDFRELHQDWIINKDLNSFHNLDYSQPAVQEYLRLRFGALNGNLDGLMVDYADQLWFSLLYGHSPDRRLATSIYENIPEDDKTPPAIFADSKMTATAFYRILFRCVKDALGPNSWVHERNLEQPNNDLTFGITDSQRTANDTKQIDPALISRSGLRWYKNRIVTGYDMDSKELTSAWKVGGWSGTDQDGRRMLLTMAYVAASRLLIANSFRDLSPETLHDLERTFPYPTEPRSARPVDAFTHHGWPRVYDFAVNPDWHQVTLFNNALPTREETIAVPLAGEQVDGALGLDPDKAYYVYDFWNSRFAGKVKGSEMLVQELRAGEARMLSIHAVEKVPQFLSTDRHLMQGLLDMPGRPAWNVSRNTLTGTSKVVGGEPYKVVVACNGFKPVAASAGQAAATLEPLIGTEDLAVLSITSAANADVEWHVTFGE
jgi:hypothetical protein